MVFFSKILGVFFALSLLAAPFVKAQEEAVHTERNTECLVCVFSMLILQQNAEHDERIIADLLYKGCSYLPDKKSQLTCKITMKKFGPQLIDAFLKKHPADKACSEVGLCTDCKINRGEQEQYQGRMLASLMGRYMLAKESPLDPFGPDSPYLEKVDVDNDGYSPEHQTPRGADWRGKDCDDSSNAIHPGLYDNPKNAKVDANCNGIYGYNPQGKAYESLLCNEDDARSVVVFGDSVGAAFTIPPEWVLMQNLSQVLPASIDELDHPQLSAWSGWDPSINNLSLYSQLRLRNRCNHRDFQNLAKNGAQMVDLVPQINAMTVPDKPVFAYIGYVGNDVCKSSLDRMTEPGPYRQQFIAGLNALSQKVKKHSYVVSLGVVDGRVLWDTMHNQTHPLGVTYANFYEFLTCCGANPCTTWLNPNPAIRDATSARAAELSKQMADVAANMHFDNLSVFYIDFAELLKEALQEVADMGLPRKDLISPMDGFHPSLSLGHRILAKKVWNKIMTYVPEFAGPENIANDVIEQLFGNQGGF